MEADIISSTNYESVSVIASFDTEGHVRPLFVRVNSESLKVHSCWQKPSFRGTIEFQCKVIDNDCLKNLNVIYRQSDNIWSIVKDYIT